MTDRDRIEALGDLQPGEWVRVTLDDGTTVDGEANPVDYDPEERLRVEIEQIDDSRVRYEVSAERRDGEWTAPTVQEYAPGQDEWEPIGDVADVERE